MSKNTEDAITNIEIMSLNEHQCQYNCNPYQRKNENLELNTNEKILA